MPTFKASELAAITADILRAVGATPEEARIVTDALIESNLEGHDSHGVVRLPEYVKWVEKKYVVNGARLEVEKETENFVMMNANWGWGQVMGKLAMEYAIEKAKHTGVLTITVRECAHIGRAGDYPLIAARAGFATVMFVNTNGAGRLVAPFGGTERRLSSNPVAVGIPRTSKPPIIMDYATSVVAGGKVSIALHSGKQLAPGCLLDSKGQPSTNPADFNGPPQGALLPFGGYKGYALGLVADILGGAFSGAGCSRPNADRVGNSFMATLVDPAQFRDRAVFDQEVDALVEFVKSSKLAEGFSEILIPGEPELKARERREKEGIPVDDVTWGQIQEAAARYGVKVM